MAQRVLIVEDDPDVVQLARAYLEREGFVVEARLDGLSGLEAALERPPELIVLDWMLPHLDGIGFLGRLRRESRTPVILLTARTEESDRVLGLELGADDYVPKPFSPRELVARVKAVLRRTSGPEEEAEGTLVHAGIELSPRYRTASYYGSPLPLTTLEFELLRVLLQAPGRVFTRSELLDRVWGADFTGVDRVVDVHVSNLRQKLTAAGAGAKPVSVRGVGYKID